MARMPWDPTIPVGDLNEGIPEPPPVKRPRSERMAQYQQLLTNFTYGLGRGLEAASVNPRGRRQRTQAGMGAVLTAPIELQRQQQAIDLQQASEERQRTQAEVALEQNRRANLQLPAQLEQILANTQRTQAQVPQIQAQTSATQAGIPLTQARTEGVQATTEATRMGTTRAKFLNTSNGVMDVTTQKIVPGTEPSTMIDVTPEIATTLQLPANLVGQRFKASELNAMASAFGVKTVIARSTNGVQLINSDTGELIKQIGDLPPTAGGLLPSEADDSVVQDAADRVARGELTIYQASNLLGGVRGGKGAALLRALGARRVAPVAVRQALADIATSQALVDNVDRLMHNIIDNKVGQVSGSLLLEDYTESIGSLMAKGFGEIRPTDQDVQRVMNIVPGWREAGFAPAYAEAQIGELRNTMKAQEDALTQRYFRELPSAGGGNRGGAPTPAPAEEPDFIQGPNGLPIPNPRKR